MSVKVVQDSIQPHNLTLSVIGRFDYSVHKAFREAYVIPNGIPNDGRIQHYKIDLSQTEYMDSSALGMLLIIKEYAEQHGASVTLHNPQPMVRKVLEIANFNRFFKLTDGA